MSDFIRKCLTGDALMEDIDDYVDAWHENSSGKPLFEFLGMSKNEYALWVRDADILPFIITAHREKKDVSTVLDEFYALPLAARANGPKRAQQLLDWLKSEGLWK